MFDRYTESARRTLFFARHAVTQLGTASIGTEHVLIGLLRDARKQSIVARILARFQISPVDLRRDLETRFAGGKKIDTSVEVPFGADTKDALRFAADEADSLHHDYIGTEHLLLGLLRAEGSVAASILSERGLRLDDVRTTIVTLLAEPPPEPESPSRAELIHHIEEIARLVRQLARAAAGSVQADPLTDRIESHLAALRQHLIG